MRRQRSQCSLSEIRAVTADRKNAVAKDGGGTRTVRLLLAMEVAGYFEFSAAKAKTMAKEVARIGAMKLLLE